MNSPIAWRGLLEKKEYSVVMKRLEYMVAHHRLLGKCSDTSEREDIPYDAFLFLLEEGSFDWYLQHPEMSDLEIDRRIYSINLNNFLHARNRKQNPENWRLAMRVSNLLKTRSSFRCFDNVTVDSYVRTRKQVYGLSIWPKDKVVKDPNILSTLLETVAVRCRNSRQVGCTGDADLVITNNDLNSLIVEIFMATDSPCTISDLRLLVFSKLTTYSNHYTYFEEEQEDKLTLLEILPSEYGDPDEGLRSEAEILHLTKLCDEVLDLQASYYNQLRLENEFKIERMFKGLQMLYFGPRSLTAWEISQQLGISDSLVSEWKLRFETDVIALRLSLSQLRIFNEILEERLQNQRRLPEISHQEYGITLPEVSYLDLVRAANEAMLEED